MLRLVPILVLLAAGPAAAEQRAGHAAASQWISDILNVTGEAMELAGVAVIVGGVVWALAKGFRRLLARAPGEEIYTAMRLDMGRGLLLGLEMLIAADIIETLVIEPSFSSIGVLGGILLIRTFLAFTLERELRHVGGARHGRPG